jgi:hypothetical protein
VDWVYRWKADEEILDQREAIDKPKLWIGAITGGLPLQTTEYGYIA